MARASIAEKMRLKPQLSHDESMAKPATSATAALGERGRAAIQRMSRCTGGAAATT